MRRHAHSEKFFTSEEKEKLKTTIHDVETRTTGEIVIMVVDHSDRYREAEFVASVLLASLLSLIVSMLFFHSSIWSYIPLSFLFFFPCWLLLMKVKVAKRPFISARTMEEAVSLRAEAAFFERGLHKTKKNTGVLFFLSLFEKKVRVLADTGIYTKMEQKTLSRFANDVSKGIREGRACDGLSQAIQEIGGLLSTHFPITADDTNELPDDVITEE